MRDKEIGTVEPVYESMKEPLITLAFIKGAVEKYGKNSRYAESLVKYIDKLLN